MFLCFFLNVLLRGSLMANPSKTGHHVLLAIGYVTPKYTGKGLLMSLIPACQTPSVERHRETYQSLQHSPSTVRISRLIVMVCSLRNVVRQILLCARFYPDESRRGIGCSPRRVKGQHEEQLFDCLHFRFKRYISTFIAGAPAS